MLMPPPLTVVVCVAVSFFMVVLFLAVIDDTILATSVAATDTGLIDRRVDLIEVRADFIVWLAGSLKMNTHRKENGAKMIKPGAMARLYTKL